MRRRERVDPQREAAREVPLWVRQIGPGLRYVSGKDPARVLRSAVDLGEALPKLRAARAAWCTENGCYRQGKTCREVFGTSRGLCAGAGGPATEGEG